MGIARRVLFGAALTATVAIIWASQPGNASVAVRADDVRRPAPNFKLIDANGKSVKMSDYKGKVVLVNFWATWCGPCRMEIPWFIDFEIRYHKRGFAVVGISMDEDGWKAVRPWVAREKMNYKVVLGTKEVAKAFGDLDSLPSTLLIDRQGRIASLHVGLVSRNIYEDEIAKLLEQ